MKTRKPWGPKTDLFHQPPCPEQYAVGACPVQYAVGACPVQYAVGAPPPVPVQPIEPEPKPKPKLNLRELSKTIRNCPYCDHK